MKRAGLQARLGDAEQDRRALGRLAAGGDRLLVLLVELDLVDLLALQERGAAGLGDLPLLQHLADDHLDVLVVDLHALQPVDLLHLLDQVVGQRLDAHDGEDVMGGRVAVHDVLALLDEVAFLHRDVLALRHHVLDRLGAFLDRLDGDPALVLEVLAEVHVAGDLGDDRVVLGTPRLEEFGHPRQTAGDVLGLGALARDTRDDVAGPQLLAVLDREDGVDRHGVDLGVAVVEPHRLAGRRVHDDDLGLEVVAARGRAPVGDDLLADAGGVVRLLADREARR